MRYFKIISVIALSVSLFCQCRKEKQDNISKQIINGMVYNNCTDSGLANVKVYLQTIKDNAGVVNSIETTSDNKGNFTFTNADIHSREDYHYPIYIASVSGIGANSPEYSIFNGTTLHFTKEQVGEFLKPRVTPGFYNFCWKINNTNSIVPPDSISVYFEQKVLRKNDINSTYGYPDNSTTGKGIMSSNISPMSEGSDCMGTRWMGKWNIVIEKKKAGVYSITYDSVYIPFQGYNTYTVNW